MKSILAFVLCCVLCAGASAAPKHVVSKAAYKSGKAGAHVVKSFVSHASKFVSVVL